MLKKIEHIIRSYFPKRLKNYRFFLSALKGLRGIEIGGPSPTFTTKGFLPVYDVIAGLDGCNFSNSTVWEGDIKEGKNFKYGNHTGYQIISDGTQLPMIPDEKYDFVLSCHSIEHIANPVKALNEWKRILKNKGYVLLIVPHKDRTFDHNRPVTSIEHLLQDEKNNTQENDETHFEEVISLHDISMDDGIKDLESLIVRTKNNYENRCVHQHIFNTPLVAKLANHVALKILDIRHFNPFNIVMLLQKTENIKPDNSRFLDPSNEIYQNEKFPSDKLW